MLLEFNRDRIWREYCFAGWVAMFNHLLLITALFLAQSAFVTPSIEAAQANFSAGNYNEGIRILLAVHDLAPQEPAINYWLERSFYEKQDYEQAIAYGEQAVRVASQNAEYHRWLGRVYGAKAEQVHSFFLARKVKSAFETAVRLDPLNIAAERDFIQYLVEAPWIVGGDKEKAKRQIDYVATLDPLQGRLARAALFAAEKRWKQAELEYLAVLDQQPREKEPYMEAADFFEGRRDADNLDRVLEKAKLIQIHDPRIEFYRAVVLVLRRADLHTAEVLLGSYVDKVPERSDYPSHKQATVWLQAARANESLARKE